jgi:hypothetical protein
LGFWSDSTNDMFSLLKAGGVKPNLDSILYAALKGPLFHPGDAVPKRFNLPRQCGHDKREAMSCTRLPLLDFQLDTHWPVLT